MPDRLVTAEINLAAYRHNLTQLRQRLQPGVALMAVVKANAYGHGAVALAQAAAASGCEYLGVVCLAEAKELRAAGITTPILLLNYLDSDSLAEALTLDLTLTVMDQMVIEHVAQLAQEQRQLVKLHLKVDTGMHRAGCQPGQVVPLARAVEQAEYLELEGVFTHFAAADDSDLSFTQLQLDHFQHALAELEQANIRPRLKHAANSAATLALPSSHFDMVRPGIASFGLSPFAPDHPAYETFYQTFQPILQLKTSVVAVRELEPGETVGYGCTFTAEKKMQVALLPVGYGDGFRRAPHPTKQVLLHGQPASIIGRVSMDQTTIDVTDIPDVQVGDEVVLIGHQHQANQSADEIAQNWGTINYEVITSLASRVTRQYVAE